MRDETWLVVYSIMDFTLEQDRHVSFNDILKTLIHNVLVVIFSICTRIYVVHSNLEG